MTVSTTPSIVAGKLTEARCKRCGGDGFWVESRRVGSGWKLQGGPCLHTDAGDGGEKG
jgi:hypothetical protein